MQIAAFFPADILLTGNGSKVTEKTIKHIKKTHRIVI